MLSIGTMLVLLTTPSAAMMAMAETKNIIRSPQPAADIPTHGCDADPSIANTCTEWTVGHVGKNAQLSYFLFDTGKIIILFACS